MRSVLPVIFFITSFILFFLNIFALMRLIPLVLTLPLLFLSIYLMIFTATHRRMYRGMR